MTVIGNNFPWHHRNTHKCSLNPPLTKVICFGEILAKSFAGETTFAAIFVVNVAIIRTIEQL